MARPEPGPERARSRAAAAGEILEGLRATLAQERRWQVVLEIRHQQRRTRRALFLLPSLLRFVRRYRGRARAGSRSGAGRDRPPARAPLRAHRSRWQADTLGDI